MSDTTRTPSTPRVDKSVDTVTSLGGAVSGTAQGRTVIDDAVIAKVAGIAAREVPGVFALGNNAARAFGAIRSAVGGNDLAQGVRVEVGETQVAVDVTLVVEYPVPMQTVADRVRDAVGEAITGLVGMAVAEINVAIVDVHIPGDDDSAETESRVR
ncbi:Asp23/Gls24 family envelope stress response protein [Rathayibacter sp. ZW T2_19]|uniref:Asp23/Gls24 family envelope stress response protein n=1 Tax=Rathayibacter rubneri TaxID=2950106 RepID=A0A9X2E0D5_9MICO|nr:MULTISPECIES: Asp23/Gls24 family envelope stress response protein [Rathayibacter]MBO0983170.1 Asp23/Gls24 family envelope stress response protein [Rathayibacter sp. SD072]MCM6764033.1 Asp23/Gls24 family envelope stress response protein [Rathayibacter rubneri]